MSFELNRSFVNRPRRALATIVALTTAIAGASVLTAVVNHHPSVGVTAPAVDLNAFPAVTCAEAVGGGASLLSDPIVQEDQARALRVFNGETPAPSDKMLQMACFVEYHFEPARAGEIKEVNIQGKGANLFVVHDPRPRVVVFAGKRTAAQTYERARDYARKFDIKLKRDGEKVNARLVGPTSQPDDAWGDLSCIVIAPPGVKVTANSE